MLWEVKGQAERESRRGTWAQRFPCPLHRSPWDISSPAGPASGLRSGDLSLARPLLRALLGTLLSHRPWAWLGVGHLSVTPVLCFQTPQTPPLGITW